MHWHINKNDPNVPVGRARLCMRQQKHLMTSSRAGTCNQSFKKLEKEEKSNSPNILSWLGLENPVKCSVWK